MGHIYYINFCFLLCLVYKTNSWEYFKTLSELSLNGTISDTMHTHSEYIFGDCTTADKKERIYYNVQDVNVTGKVIVRGWIDLKQLPTCIILKGRAYEEDTFRNTAYQFQFCVSRITYLHATRKHQYYYYEWYLPTGVIEGMTWDIYFYEP